MYIFSKDLDIKNVNKIKKVVSEDDSLPVEFKSMLAKLLEESKEAIEDGAKVSLKVKYDDIDETDDEDCEISGSVLFDDGKLDDDLEWKEINEDDEEIDNEDSSIETGVTENEYESFVKEELLSKSLGEMLEIKSLFSDETIEKIWEDLSRFSKDFLDIAMYLEDTVKIKQPNPAIKDVEVEDITEKVKTL